MILKFSPNRVKLIYDAITDILLAINEGQEGVKETPMRVANSYAELFNQKEFDFTLFPSRNIDEMIIEKDLPFYTFCEHHFLPFFGTISIGYIPNGNIVGISKLARTVDYFSRRLNTQEYMMADIADFIQEKLNPKGMGIVIKARHLCQEMRGIKKKGEMVTSVMKGVFLENIHTRNEFLSLLK
jgi:GTP cyclohydrolase I